MLNSACRELTFYCFPPKSFEEGTSVSSYDKGCVDPAQMTDKEGILHTLGFVSYRRNKSDITCLKTQLGIFPYNTHNSAQTSLTAAVELQIIVTMLQ